MGKAKGTALLFIAAIILYIVINFLQPVYQYFWLLYVTRYYPIITLKFLGYVYIGVAIACGLGYIYVAQSKNNKRLMRSILFIATCLCIIAAMPLVWPEWFFSYWSF